MPKELSLIVNIPPHLHNQVFSSSPSAPTPTAPCAKGRVFSIRLIHPYPEVAHTGDPCLHKALPVRRPYSSIRPYSPAFQGPHCPHARAHARTHSKHATVPGGVFLASAGASHCGCKSSERGASGERGCGSRGALIAVTSSCFARCRGHGYEAKRIEAA